MSKLFRNIQVTKKAMKMKMRITDNHHEIAKEDFVAKYPKLSKILLDRNIRKSFSRRQYLCFPNDLQYSPIWIRNKRFWKRSIREIKTGNVIGFLGYGQERLTISSRFSIKGDDYFYIIFYKRFFISISLV